MTKMSVLKVVAVLAPAIASAAAGYFKNSAETAAGYHALKDTVENQGETITRLETEIHELRSALLMRAMTTQPAPVSVKPLAELGRFGGFGAGKVQVEVDAPKAMPRMLKPLPKNPSAAMSEGF